MEKTREERRAAFHSAMAVAMNLRTLYRDMDLEDRLEAIKRYAATYLKKQPSEIFDAPLVKLFDLGEELGSI